MFMELSMIFNSLNRWNIISRYSRSPINVMSLYVDWTTNNRQYCYFLQRIHHTVTIIIFMTKITIDFLIHGTFDEFRIPTIWGPHCARGFRLPHRAHKMSLPIFVQIQMAVNEINCLFITRLGFFENGVQFWRPIRPKTFIFKGSAAHREPLRHCGNLYF